jgi:Domain of unknown function (DUF4280)
MACQVVMGAVIECTLGSAPSALLVSSNTTVNAGSLVAATIDDFASITNIPTFGTCDATTSACVPATTAWTPGSANVTIGNLAALDDSSTCQCSLGGTISITSAGQTTVQIS